jgi:hypothetical protein
MHVRDGVVGEYMCRSIGSRPCDTQTGLRLQEEGTWGWGRYAGEYEVTGGHARFQGHWRLAGWGPAEIGAGTLTFRDERGASVWRKE